VDDIHDSGPGAAVSYRRASLDERYDAIVVGSGVGGLTSAMLLAKHAGKRVLVLERHYTPGGLTQVFRRPGFEWDVGLHYVGQVNVPGSDVHTMVEHVTGGRMRWSAMPDVYDRLSLGGRTYDYEIGVERLRERMLGYFPQERPALDRYFATIDRAVIRLGLYFAERLVPSLLSGIGSTLLRPFYLPYAGRSTASVMSGFVTNPELAGVLTGQWGQYGLPPGQSSFGTHALVTRTYFAGGAYPVGGSGQVYASIAPDIVSTGGSVVVRAEVNSILVEQGAAVGVRMSDGVVIRAPLVMSDAGARVTYGTLLRDRSPAVERRRALIEAIPPSMGHICLYVGLNGTDAELGLTGTNRWIIPTPDHDENLRRFSADATAEFPFLFFSFPSAKDPSFATRFPGRATITIISPAPFEWFAKWRDTRWHKRGAEYDDFKDGLRSRMLAALHEHFPTTRGRVAHAELSTPLSVRHFANHPHGEIYGLAHTPERFRLREIGPRTPIRGLYLTGADSCVLGVLGAIAGGIIATSAALHRNLFMTVTKATARGFKP
jgi:all-trans-retinol 13,14-reductase